MQKTYQKNNILFRIASADAISKFKAAQANSFLQLARKDFEFDDSAKEVVLLEFDRLSVWIYRFEKSCISTGHGAKANDQLIGIFFKSFLEELRTIENVMMEHPNIFSDTVREFTKLVHQYSGDLAQDLFYSTIGKDLSKSYIQILKFISDYLQHLLTSMHEFNNNIIRKKRRPFLSVTEYSTAVTSANMLGSFEPVAVRAQFFVAIGVRPLFVVKDYTNSNITQSVKAVLQPFGIEIVDEDVSDSNFASLSPSDS